MDIAQLIADFGFPTVMVVGLGYFVYFVYNFIQEHLDPATEKMHFQLIGLSMMSIRIYPFYRLVKQHPCVNYLQP